MKKILILVFALAPLFYGCGGSETDKLLTPHQLDSLVNGHITLPEITTDTVSATTIDMGGGETDPKSIVQVQTVAGQQRIVFYIPVIEDGPHIGKLTLNVELKADTVYSYSMSAISAKSTSITPVESRSKPSKHYILKNDTKYAIGRRLGVPASSILNKEPLQVGEEIKLKN